MVQSRLAVVFIIGVLQVCTASVTSDAAKLFSSNELQRAKNVGISERKLIELNANGFTFEEMINLNELQQNGPLSRENITFEFMTKVCEILDAKQKTSTSHTSAQETRLQDIFGLALFFRDHYQAPYARSTICAYISQPDLFDMEANSFGLEFSPYMEHRFLKMEAQKASGAERVKLTKEMCCVYENREKRTLLAPSTFSGLPDEELNEFDKHWNAFETANTSKAFENVCDFLHTKNPNDDECNIIDRVDDRK